MPSIAGAVDTDGTLIRVSEGVSNGKGVGFASAEVEVNGVSKVSLLSHVVKF